jgi:hypothetical protein
MSNDDPSAQLETLHLQFPSSSQVFRKQVLLAQPASAAPRSISVAARRVAARALAEKPHLAEENRTARP